MNKQASGLKEMLLNKDYKNTGVKNKSRVIAIASGKGGVGKSTVTVNLALALQELDKRVFIIDSDIGMANIDIMLDINTKYDLHHVFKGICSFEEAIVRGPYGLDVLSGISGLDELVEVSFDDINNLLVASAKLEEKYNYILLDTGAGAAKSIINIITAAGEIIIVLTPEPTSIMDAYSLIKILAAKNYSGVMHLLINQVDKEMEGIKIIDRMIKTVNKYLDVNLNKLGFIPYENNISHSIKIQQPFYKMYPEKAASKALLKIAGKICGETPELPSPGIKGFMYRLVGMINGRR